MRAWEAWLVGVTLYYGVHAAVRNYAFAEGLDAGVLAWTILSIVVGPVLGWCGASVWRRRERPPVAAVAAPSVVLLAEGLFFIADRRMWLYNFVREPHRLADLAVVVGFLAVAVLLPLSLVRDRSRLRRVYALVGGLGAAGAVGCVVAYRLLLI